MSLGSKVKHDTSEALQYHYCYRQHIWRIAKHETREVREGGVIAGLWRL